MLCNENKFVFIRTTRTGSNSLVQALRKHVTLHQEVPGIPHPTMAHFMYHRHEDYHKYKTFGFVRNPWSWYVSFWSIMATETHTFEQFLQGRPALAAFHNASPLSWLTHWNSHIIAVDHVFRFEKYDQSHDQIREITGVDFVVDETNPGRYTGHYSDYYNSTTKEIVNYRCRDCILRYGYEFGKD